MTKLTDLQLVLLSTAAARLDGSLLPPPDSVAGEAARIRKAIPPLLKRAFVVEINAADPARMWREDGKRLIGIAITDVGRTAIGAELRSEPAPATPDQPPQVLHTESATAANVPVARRTKSAEVVAMLQRDEGVTLAELVTATGWLPHTTRAALTGLRKKGHAITRGGAIGDSRYHLAQA